MVFIKRFLLLALLGCSAVLWGSEEATVKTVVESAIKAGSMMDFSTAKQYYSHDYVKIVQDKKILDSKLLENTATYFKRIQDPALTFSELVKLNFMLKEQTLTDAQLANYRRLDSTERGKALVKQAQSQVKAQQDNLRQIANDVLSKYQYGSGYIGKNLAVLFYKLDFVFKIKGVLVLRKENNLWKIYREFSTLDPEKDFSAATETEVREFVNESHKAARDLTNFTDFQKYYSKESLSVFSDGKSMDYQQAEKRAKFYSMLQSGTPTMVQAAPLFMEICGQKVTAEMFAHFADQDKSGKGREWIMRYKNIIEKYRSDMKKMYQYSIQKIFVFEDCALVMDQFYLPNTGSIERISLIKKHQKKYLFYRSVSRKSNVAQPVKGVESFENAEDKKYEQ